MNRRAIRAFDFRAADRAERTNNLLRPLTLSDKSCRSHWRSVANFAFSGISHDAANKSLDRGRHRREMNQEPFVAIRHRACDLAMKRAINPFSFAAGEQHF